MNKREMKNRNLVAKFILASAVMIAFFLFSIGIAASQSTCSSSSQTIMKLTSATNAHAELASQTNYAESVCYEKIFGSNYTGSNPQTCTGSNKVVGLSSETNAHAESPYLTNYATNVCYGNLNCTARSSCQTGEAIVVSLSSDTNAHLASDGSYSTKICCSSAGVTPPPCAIQSCSMLGKRCGTWNNGCGQDQDCGSCPSGQTCDNGACTSIIPECVPKTCTELGMQCGTWSDGCGGSTSSCGSCPSGQTCSDGICTAVPPADDDNDGVSNANDLCPNTPLGEIVDTNGCSASQKDSDGDTIMDNVDKCINTPADEKTSVITESSSQYYGCGPSERDIDNDGIKDNVDKCPNTPEGERAYIVTDASSQYYGCSPAITSAKWTDLNSIEITSAEINDAVGLNADGYGLNGRNITFSVYKDGGGCGLLWLSDCQIGQLSTIAQSDSVSAIWQASDAGTIYFKAEIVETGQGIESSNLAVSSTEDNSNPIAVINSPTNGARFEINTQIAFLQSSYDEDDDISATWNFDDGNTTTLTNCQSGGSCNIIHVYTTQGTKNVILKITDARGRTDTKFVSIDIFQANAVNVFARISEPQPNQIIQGAGWVHFNASGSYASNCSSTCPSGGTGSCYAVGNMQCINLNSNNLMFNWTFDDGTTRYGTWQNNYSYVVNFNKFFGDVGEHTATLKVGYP